MLDFIRKRLQQRHLQNLMTQDREKRIDNWEQVKKIGIVFNVGDSEHWSLLHRFITAQERCGKEVTLIGFQAEKQEINYIFSHTRTTICHEKEDFNWIGLPKDGVIDPFKQVHFDIVIDTTEQPCFFGKYITAMADAKLKVGYSNSENDVDEGIMDMYDMAIRGKEPLDLKDFIEQTVKYLTMIHKEPELQ